VGDIRVTKVKSFSGAMLSKVKKMQ